MSTTQSTTPISSTPTGSTTPTTTNTIATKTAGSTTATTTASSKVATTLLTTSPTTTLSTTPTTVMSTTKEVTTTATPSKTTNSETTSTTTTTTTTTTTSSETRPTSTTSTPTSSSFPTSTLPSSTTNPGLTSVITSSTWPTSTTLTSTTLKSTTIDNSIVRLSCVGEFCKRSCNPTQLKFKLRAVCSTTCTQYKWRIYKNSSGENTELLIDTTVKSDDSYSIITLPSNSLQPGVIHKYRIEVGEVFAEMNLPTCEAPIQGQCSPEKGMGVALQDWFTINCVDWVLPGNVARDGSTDITFSTFAIVDDRGYMVARGRGVSASQLGPFILPEGDKNQDYSVKVRVDIATEYGSIQSVDVIFQIQPNLNVDSQVIRKEINTSQNIDTGVKTALLFLSTIDAQEVDDEMAGTFTTAAEKANSPQEAETAKNILVNIVGKCSKGKREDIVRSIPAIMGNYKTVTSDFKVDSQFLDMIDGTADIISTVSLSWKCNEEIKEHLLDDPSPEERDTEAVRVAAANVLKSEECWRIGKAITESMDHAGQQAASVVAEGDSYSSAEGSAPGTKLLVLKKKSASFAGRSLSIKNGGTITIPGSILGEDGVTDGGTTSVVMTSYTKESNMFQGPNSGSFGIDIGGVDGKKIPIQGSKEYMKINLKSASEGRQVSTMPCTGSRLINVTGGTNLLLVTDNGCNFIVENDDSSFSSEDHEASAIERQELGLEGNIKKMLLIDIQEDVVFNVTFTPETVTNGDGDINTTLVISTFTCQYEKDGKWEQVPVSQELPSLLECQCLTNHLTLFSSTWVVPPNTIDFSTVFQNLDQKILENIHVILTVSAFLLLYFVLLFVLRRMDKRDLEKWAVAPLSDNLPEDGYHYHITVHTGTRSGAETNSTIYLVLVGEMGETEVRKLHSCMKKSFSRGSVNQYLLSVPSSLGSLIYVRIWHDNNGTGARASWFLDRIAMKDLQTEEKSVFLCNRWLAVDREDGQIERVLPVATQDDLKKFSFLFQAATRKDMTDGHLWFSLMTRPTQSRFTRVQRLSCCLALLFSTMIANAMWYRADDDIEGKQYVRIGPLTFTPQQMFISIVSSLVSIPPSVLIVFLFRRSGRRPLKVPSKPKPKEETPKERKDMSVSTVSFSNETVNGNDKCQSWLWQADNNSVGGTMPWMIDAKSNRDQLTPEADSKNISPDAITLSNELDVQKEQEKQGALTIPEAKVSSGVTKNKQGGCMLPWWCVFVAWFLVFTVVLVSAFFTILYSFEWGSEKSLSWLISFLLSFFQSIFLIQPIKVILLAIVVSLIFKSPPDEDSDFTYQDVLEKTKQPQNTTGEDDHHSHRVPYQEKACDADHLKRMKEAREKELRMFAIFKEISVYILYLILISVLTYDSRDSNAFRTKAELSAILNVPAFSKARTQGAVFEWIKGNLVPNMYAETWYNDQEVKWRLKYFLSDLYYFRIGYPRLRLARVKSTNCKLAGSILTKLSAYDDCYHEYSLDSLDSQDYDEGWNDLPPFSNNTSTISPWRYSDTLQLDGAPLWGQLQVYGGGGYVAELGSNINQARSVVLDLESKGWLDRASRALFVEFNLYNPSTNLFSMVTFMAEMPPTGGNVNHAIVQTIQMYSYVGTRALFLVLLQIVFVAFVLYHIYVMVKGWKREKGHWFSSKWNILEFCSISSAVVTCVMFGIRVIMLRYTMNKFQNDQGSYVNFAYVIYWDELYSYMLGCLVFLAMLKLLRLLKFNQKVTELISTLQVSVKPLVNFMMFFVVVYLAFAQLGYLLFGRLLEDYSSLISSMESMFSMMLMNFSFHELARTNPVLGPAFFLLFIVVLVFVVMNMLLSIINESYSTVQSKRLMTSNDYEMVDYMIEQLKGVIGVSSLLNTDMETNDTDAMPQGKGLLAKMNAKQKTSGTRGSDATVKMKY